LQVVPRFKNRCSSHYLVSARKFEKTPLERDRSGAQLRPNTRRWVHCFGFVAAPQTLASQRSPGAPRVGLAIDRSLGENFTIGAGEMQFATHWSSANADSIHCYRGNVASLALARRIRTVTKIGDARRYNTSSTSRTAGVGDFIIIRNQSGYFAALQ
jgi:hypothetical protein